jgi:uncharacterized protein (TIGR00369 family)
MTENTAPEAEATPPEGFRPMHGRGAFSTRNGPYYFKKTETGAAQAFFASDHHCNGVGIVHGGMLAAFMDGLLAHAAHNASERPLVTIQLNVNYLAAARKGDWVIGEAQVTRATRDLVFVEARLHVGGKDVVRGGGVFKAADKRAKPSSEA